MLARRVAAAPRQHLCGRCHYAPTAPGSELTVPALPRSHRRGLLNFSFLSSRQLWSPVRPKCRASWCHAPPHTYTHFARESRPNGTHNKRCGQCAAEGGVQERAAWTAVLRRPWADGLQRGFGSTGHIFSVDRMWMCPSITAAPKCGMQVYVVRSRSMCAEW